MKNDRNQPCACGSGRKFKHCCGAVAAPRPAVDVAWQRTETLFRAGSASLAAGHAGEARSCFQQAVAGCPPVPELLASLGNALDLAGMKAEAVAAYRRALAVQPDFPEGLNNLALTLQSLGEHEEAERHYRRALALKPDYLGAHFNLGLLLQAMGRPGDAAHCYRQVLALQPDHAQASSNLGIALEAQGETEAALAAYDAAIALDPTLVAARSRSADLLARSVPTWHVPMMNDSERNEAYLRALRTAVTPDTAVFEIGTGSGLLSMMAARLGARTVTTCEAEPLVAEAAKKVIADNGFDTRIKLIPRRSTSLEVGADLAQPADLLVSELFSSELLGERVLDSIEDAKRRLLRPGARVIPAVGSVMIALFGGEDIGSNLVVEEVHGFDLSSFNRIVAQRQTIARTDLPIEMLSQDVEAFRFDFEGESAWAAEAKTLHVRIERPGRCLGVIQWMRLGMDSGDSGNVFENHPSVKAPASSWTRCAYLLPRPIEVQAGQVAVISAAHNRVCPWFSIDRMLSAHADAA